MSAHGFNSVRSRFESFSICFSFAITSFGRIPLRTLATSDGMVCAVRARSSASCCNCARSMRLEGATGTFSEVEESRGCGGVGNPCPGLCGLADATNSPRVKGSDNQADFFTVCLLPEEPRKSEGARRPQGTIEFVARRFCLPAMCASSSLGDSPDDGKLAASWVCRVYCAKCFSSTCCRG
jgi:hypothetical protein